MFNKLLTGTDTAKYVAKEFNDPAAFMVLHKMMMGMNQHNVVRGTPAELAKRFGIKLGAFNNGTRKLKSVDLIRKLTKREYMINPELMYNGPSERHFIVMHMWEHNTTRGLRE